MRLGTKTSSGSSVLRNLGRPSLRAPQALQCPRLGSKKAEAATDKTQEPATTRNARAVFKAQDQLKKAGFGSSQAEALVAFVGDVTEKLAQQEDVSSLTLTIRLLIVYLAVELGSKPDSVLKGILDLVKGLGKGGMG